MAMPSLFLLFLLSPLVFFAFRSSAIGEEFGIGVGRSISAGKAGGDIAKQPWIGPGSSPELGVVQSIAVQYKAGGGIAKKPGKGPNPIPDSALGPPGSGKTGALLAPGPAPPTDPGFNLNADPATLTPIQQACRSTNFTLLCVTSLNQSKALSPNPTSMQIIQAAISITNDNLRKAQSMIQDILHTLPPEANLTNAAQNCVEYFENADHRIKQTVAALPLGRLKDARTYLSAAHTYDYDVWSALKYVNNSKLVDQTMAFTWSLIQLSSNALNMVKAYDVFGPKMSMWEPPKSERNGFWERESGLTGGKPDPTSHLAAPRIGFPEMKPDVTVCKGGGCKYETVQAAVDAGPSDGKRYVIGIKAGTYAENVWVPLEKKNVAFLGDGIGKTIITGAKTVTTPGVSTYNTGTVGVKGDGFMASGLTIQNTAGPEAQQAVAFVSDSDHTVMEKCEFLGNQDTLYAHTQRQFYKSCRIVGNVDFIFGNSATVFQDCTVLIKPRQLTPEKGETNAVTAHGRIDSAQSEGFVFHNCLISGTKDFIQLYNSNPAVHKNYLGRPWKEFSRTVFVNCILAPLIHPDGWSPWKGDQGLTTIYYAEFQSTGPGGNVNARVPWSNQVPPDHLNTYSVENFIQGQEWIPKSSLVSSGKLAYVPSPAAAPGLAPAPALGKLANALPPGKLANALASRKLPNTASSKL